MIQATVAQLQFSTMTLPTERSFSNGLREALVDNAIWIPRFPMIPAGVIVTLALAKAPKTSWELWKLLCEYEENGNEKVKEILAPAEKMGTHGNVQRGDCGK